MQVYIGLYYPYIHFRSDMWLKTAALYWDKMARIVPAGYPTHDSETVKALRGDLGFIEDVMPDMHRDVTGVEFFDFVRRNEAELRDRYALSKANRGKIGYVFYDKMTVSLVEALMKRGLAVNSRQPWPAGHWRYPEASGGERFSDPQWVGMHSDLAYVYMTMLAKHMAEASRFLPVADSIPNYMALGAPPDAIGRALLKDLENPSLSSDNLPLVQMATLSINTLAPADPNLPVSKIVAFVKKYGGERASFQKHLGDLAHNLDLKEIRDKRALRAHLESAIRRTVVPELNDLRKKLRSAGIDSALSLTSLKVSLPPLVPALASALGFTIDPLLGGLGALSFSLAALLRGAEKARDAVYAASPVSYLLRVQKLGRRGAPILRIPARVRNALSS